MFDFLLNEVHKKKVFYCIYYLNSHYNKLSILYFCKKFQNYLSYIYINISFKQFQIFLNSLKLNETLMSSSEPKVSIQVGKSFDFTSNVLYELDIATKMILVF